MRYPDPTEVGTQAVSCGSTRCVAGWADTGYFGVLCTDWDAAGSMIRQFGLSRRLNGDSTLTNTEGIYTGPWTLLTEEDATALAAAYNADPHTGAAGRCALSRAKVIEFYRYDNDPAWPEQFS